MRIIISDDESLARDKLRLMLGSEPGIQVVAECQNGAETLSALCVYKPDLLLLDIRMPDLDGFEVLSKVARADMPMVIFTTAYDRHAVKAFEARALDYLLKPFDDARFDSALSTMTLCTIPHVAVALAELKRVLKPGADFHFAEHGRAPDPKVARNQDRFNGFQQMWAGGCNLNREIDAILSEAGFEIEAINNFYLKGGPKAAGYMYMGVARVPA